MYGSDRYKKSHMATAQPGDLVVMLYDGILRFAKAAHQGITENDPAAAGTGINRALDIIAYLQAILRNDAAPSLVDHLDMTYSSWCSGLVAANVQQNADAVAEIREQVQSLRDAWNTANEEVKAQDGAGRDAA